MKKIIVISINTSWNIYNFRLGLLQSLQKEGYKIIAVAPFDSYTQQLIAMDIEFYPITINNKGTNPIEDIKLIRSYYKIYKKLKPDIALHYTIKPNIYGTIAAWLTKTPVISNISGLGTVFLNKNISSYIAKWLYKIAMKLPKMIFFQNSHDQALFLTLGLITKNYTKLIPGSGIDTQKFLPEKIEKINKDNKKIQFLCVARLVKDKGIMEYKNAAQLLKKKYNHIEFAILGSDYPNNPSAIAKKEIQQWHNENIINYLGTTDEVRSVMLKADCIVLASYREGLSRVLLEAASLEKPIIASHVPGCQEVVEVGKNGYLCQVKNVQSLAQAMEKMLLLPPTERKKMGQYGRQKIIKEFAETLVIEHYQKEIAIILKHNDLHKPMTSLLRQPIYATIIKLINGKLINLSQLSDAHMLSVLNESEKHGVSQICYDALHCHTSLNINKTYLATFKSISSQSVSYHLIADKITIETFQLLATFKIDALLLKGAAMASLYYSEGYLRTRCDTDFLIRECDVSPVAKILMQQGYKVSGLNSRKHLSYQFSAIHIATNIVFDIHWKINNRILFQPLFDFDRCWNNRQLLPKLQNIATLEPTYLLLHACIHRIAHGRNSERNRLIWLYDIHLICKSFSEEEFKQFLSIALAKHMGALCADTLLTSSFYFKTPLPKYYIEQLTIHRKKEYSAQLITASKAQWLYSDIISNDTLIKKIQYIIALIRSESNKGIDSLKKLKTSKFICKAS